MTASIHYLDTPYSIARELDAVMTATFELAPVPEPEPTALDLLALASLRHTDPAAAMRIAEAAGRKFDRENDR